MENPYFENWLFFFCVHVDISWIGPMWPKCAFGDQKGSVGKRRAVLHSPRTWKNVCGLLKIEFSFYFIGPKAVFWSKAANPNRCGRLPSPGNAHTPHGARRRLALGDASSPKRSNDGSGARSPRTAHHRGAARRF